MLHGFEIGTTGSGGEALPIPGSFYFRKLEIDNEYTGHKIQLNAFEIFNIEFPDDVTTDTEWTSDKPEVISIDQDGVMTLHQNGSVRIKASHKGREDTVLVTVQNLQALPTISKDSDVREYDLNRFIIGSSSANIIGDMDELWVHINQPFTFTFGETFNPEYTFILELDKNNQLKKLDSRTGFQRNLKSNQEHH